MSTFIHIRCATGFGPHVCLALPWTGLECVPFRILSCNGSVTHLPVRPGYRMFPSSGGTLRWWGWEEPHRSGLITYPRLTDRLTVSTNAFLIWKWATLTQHGLWRSSWTWPHPHVCQGGIWATANGTASWFLSAMRPKETHDHLKAQQKMLHLSLVKGIWRSWRGFTGSRFRTS